MKTKKATLYSINYPEYESDWENSPFKKNSKKIKFSLLVFEINNRPVTWTEKHYLIILTHENRKFWLEIETSYFKKPLLVFKEEKKSKQKKAQTNSITLVNIGDSCPACGFPVQEKDLECQNCKLHFN